MMPTRKKTVLLAATALMLSYGSAYSQLASRQPAISDADALLQHTAQNQYDRLDQQEATLTQILDSIDTDNGDSLSQSESSQALGNHD